MNRKLEICKKCDKMKREGKYARCDIFEFDYGYVERRHKHWTQKQDWEKEEMSNISNWEKRIVPDKIAKFKKNCVYIDEYEKIFHPPMKMKKINEDELDVNDVVDFSSTKKKESILKKDATRDIEICKKCEVEECKKRFKMERVKSRVDEFEYDTCYCPLDSQSFNEDKFETLEPPGRCPHYVEHIASVMNEEDRESLLAFNEENMKRDVNICKKCLSFLPPYKQSGHLMYGCFVDGRQTGVYSVTAKDFKERSLPMYCAREGEYKVKAWEKSRHEKKA